MSILRNILEDREEGRVPHKCFPLDTVQNKYWMDLESPRRLSDVQVIDILSSSNKYILLFKRSGSTQKTIFKVSFKVQCGTCFPSSCFGCLCISYFFSEVTLSSSSKSNYIWVYKLLDPLAIVKAFCLLLKNQSFPMLIMTLSYKSILRGCQELRLLNLFYNTRF